MKRKNMVLVGPAGCGKSTNAAKIATAYGLKHWIESEVFYRLFSYTDQCKMLEAGDVLLVGETHVVETEAKVISYGEAMKKVNSRCGRFLLLTRKEATCIY